MERSTWLPSVALTNHQRTSCHTLTTANHTSSRPFSVEVMVGILLVALLSGRVTPPWTRWRGVSPGAPSQTSRGIGPHTQKHDDDELPYPSASTATPLDHRREQASDTRRHQCKRDPHVRSLEFRPTSSMGQAWSTRTTLDVQTRVVTSGKPDHIDHPIHLHMKEVKHPTTKISSVFASIGPPTSSVHILPPLPQRSSVIIALTFI